MYIRDTTLEQERLRRELQIRPSPSVIRFLYHTGQIKEEDYRKYMLCDDLDYVPPLINR